MKKIYLIMALFLPFLAQAQMKVGDNPNAINPSAVLEAESATKGFLMPRLTTTQMNAISNPANGLMIYNITEQCIYIFRGATSGWKSTCSELPVWGLNGNTGNPTTAFLGTSDNQPIRIKTNNVERAVITPDGFMGIGVTAPAYVLDVAAATNPVRFSGIQVGSTADSVLTIDANGVVRKRSVNAVIAKALTANSGLSVLNNTITLGGSLQQQTEISLNNYNISYTGTGNMGIGTSNPSFKLDVFAGSNPVRFQGLGLGQPSDYIITDSAGILRHRPLSAVISAGISADNALTFVANKMQLGGNLTKNTDIGLNAKNITFTGTGNIGFGVTTPSYKIDIQDAANPIRVKGLQVGNPQDSIVSIDNQGVMRYLKASDVVSNGIKIGAGLVKVGNTISYAGPIFNPNTINQYGNNIGITGGYLGVGTSNPQFPLDINATSNPVRFQFLSLGKNTDYIVTDSAGILRHRPVADVIAGAISADNAVNIQNGNIQLGGTLIKNTDIGLSSKNITFTGTGNIGFGVTTPSYKIDIQDVANPIRVKGLQVGNPQDSIVSIDNQGIMRYLKASDVVSNGIKVGAGLTKVGNVISFGGPLLSPTTIVQNGNNLNFTGGFVGIGTNNPQFPLDVNATTNPIRFQNLALGKNTDYIVTDSAGILRHRTPADILAGALSAENAITFAAGKMELGGNLTKNTNIGFNNNNITFDGNGYFGIGTTAPTHKLEVNAAADPLRLGGLLGGSSADSVLTINNLGVVKKRTVSSLLLSAGTFVNGGNALSGPGLLGSTNNQPISIITNGAPVITFGTDGSITQNSNAPVTFTGVVKANGGIDATGTNNLNTTGTGTNNIGNPNATNNISGTNNILGATNINTTGNKPTNIGNPLSTTTIDGTNFNVPNLGSGSPTDSVVMVDPITGKLKKISLAMVGAASFTVANGLNKVANHVELGGLLNKNTIIGLNTKNLEITGAGNVGIGIANPLYKFDLNAAVNPMRIQGLASGAPADSLLSLDNLGVVRKRTVNSVLVAAGTWLNGGNALTSPGLFGTTTNQPFSIITNNQPVLTFGNDGSITQSGNGTVNYTGQLNANNGFAATGTTDINTSGIAPTNIGSITGTTNILGTNNFAGTNNLMGTTNIAGNDLNINGLTSGSSADSVMVIDPVTGKVKKVSMSYLGANSFTADNGLTKTSNNVQLGGTLLKNTTVSQANFNMNFTGGKVGIGTTTPTSTLAIAGSVATAIRKTTTSGLVTDADYTVLANCTSGDVTLTLPGASTCAGRMYILIKTDDTTSKLTFTPQLKISEATNLPSINYNTRILIQSDGTDWWILNQY